MHCPKYSDFGQFFISKDLQTEKNIYIVSVLQ